MPRLVSIGNAWSLVAGRLLLVASLWQGPICWGHEHTCEGMDLAAHLARFHRAETDAMTRGWHWHLSMPNQSGNELPGDDQSYPSHPAVLLLSSGLPGAVCCTTAELAGLANCRLKSSDDGQSGLAGLALGDTIAIVCFPQQALCRLRC